MRRVVVNHAVGWAALLIPALVGASAVGQPPAVDLSPRLEPGSTLRFEHVLTLTQTQQVPGFAQATASLQLEASLRFEVTRVTPDGGGEVQLVFDRLFADLVRPSRPRVLFDSTTPRQPDAPPIARALARVAVSPVVYQLDGSGRVVSMHGAAEIGRLVEGIADGALVAGVFSEPFFAELARDVFAPAGDAADADRAGGSWRSTLAVPLGGLPGAVTEVTWTVDRVEGDRVVIAGVGETSFTRVEHPLLRGLGRHVSGEMSRFELVWDRAAGRTVRIEKARAVDARFSTQAGDLGVVTLATYSLLTRRGR